MKNATRVAIILKVVLGATALVMSNAVPVAAQTAGRVTEARYRADIPSDVVVKESHISLLKFSLNLRPAQQAYWAPVESALYEMARWQAAAPAEFGERASGRSHAAVASRLRRIAAMAGPLMKALDQNQQGTMRYLARWAGLEQLLASN
jgi:hypothetical protein